MNRHRIVQETLWSNYSGTLPGLRVLWKGPAEPSQSEREAAHNASEAPGIRQLGHGAEKEYGSVKEQCLQARRIGVIPVWLSWVDKK